MAAKHDLAALEERMELRFDRIDDRFARNDDHFGRIEERFDEKLSAMGSDLRAAFEHEPRAQTTTMMLGLVGVVLTMAALAFALARFT